MLDRVSVGIGAQGSWRVCVDFFRASSRALRRKSLTLIQWKARRTGGGRGAWVFKTKPCSPVVCNSSLLSFYWKKGGLASRSSFSPVLFPSIIPYLVSFFLSVFHSITPFVRSSFPQPSFASVLQSSSAFASGLLFSDPSFLSTGGKDKWRKGGFKEKKRTEEWRKWGEEEWRKWQNEEWRKGGEE